MYVWGRGDHGSNDNDGCDNRRGGDGDQGDGNCSGVRHDGDGGDGGNVVQGQTGSSPNALTCWNFPSQDLSSANLLLTVKTASAHISQVGMGRGEEE